MTSCIGLIVLLVCIAGVLSISEVNKQKSKEAGIKCLADPKLGLTAPDNQKISVNDLSNASKAVQCYLDCVNEGTGLTKGGILQDAMATDVIKDEPGFTPDIIKERVAKCSKVKVNDKCEQGYKIALCLNDRAGAI